MYSRVQLLSRINRWGLRTLDFSDEFLVGALPRLTERQRQVVDRRFGFSDGRNWTISEIASDIGISRERVRQLEMAAIRNLRRECIG